MSVKNYIFQTQNSVFKTLKNANLGVNVLMHKAEGWQYPNILIIGTKKTAQANGQTQLQTEIKVETQDFSPISSSTILEKIENSITREKLQQNIDFFTIQNCELVHSSIFTTMDGFFHGMILLQTILD